MLRNHGAEFVDCRINKRQCWKLVEKCREFVYRFDMLNREEFNTTRLDTSFSVLPEMSTALLPSVIFFLYLLSYPVFHGVAQVVDLRVRLVRQFYCRLKCTLY